MGELARLQKRVYETTSRVNFVCIKVAEGGMPDGWLRESLRLLWLMIFLWINDNDNFQDCRRMPDGWVRVALTLSLAPIPSLAYLARSVIMMVINFMMRVMILIMRLNRSSNKTLILDMIGFEICTVDVLISITIN